MAKKNIYEVCKELYGPFETYVNQNLQDEELQFKELEKKQLEQFKALIEALVEEHSKLFSEERQKMYDELLMKSVQNFMYDQDYELTDEEYEIMAGEFYDTFRDNLDASIEIDLDDYFYLETR